MSTTSTIKQLETGQAKLWMVLVGVDHYQDSQIPNLRYCANDCKELAETLKIATQQFQETEIIALYDGGTKSPKLSEVIGSIQKFSLAKPEDTILFFFSGHGELDHNYQPVLGVTDTKVIEIPGNKTNTFDPETGLKFNTLLQELKNSQAQRQIIWLDACQTKEELKDRHNNQNANGQIIAALQQEAKQTKQGQHFYAMLSCDQTQRSWEFSELEHGLFTYSLIKGLRGNAADANGRIEADSLFTYIKHHINEYLQLKKYPITIKFENDNSVKGLVVKPSKRNSPQVKRFPIDVHQTPRKIVNTGEDLVIGLATPYNKRKALIVDKLVSSQANIKFCKQLQDRGGFAVEYCYLEDKYDKNIQVILANYLQNQDNETFFLYLAGTVESDNNAEHELVFNSKNKINLNWLGQHLRTSPIKESIIIIDALGNQHTKDLIEILNPDKDKSLCVIVASTTYDSKQLIHQIVEVLKTAETSEKELWTANLIAQLQKKADFPAELTLQQPGLYGSTGVINIFLPEAQRTHNQVFELNICPYKGLEAFTQDDAYFFHGREELITEIIDKFQSAFLAVVGSSGSGKSSVVRAGVIPKLIKEGLFSSKLNQYQSCQTWVMRPGDNPLNALATALAPDNPDFLERVLHLGVDYLVEWLHQQPKEISVLVIDQFEELFTSKLDTDSFNFIKFIIGAITKAGDSFKVIITLRDDFLKDCLATSDLAPLIKQSTVFVQSYLTEEEYRQILEQPAQKVGLTIEEGLVNVLLQELQTQSLPLLQFALEELWHKRTPGKLTLKNYQQNIGGLGAILGKKAQETYQELTNKQQECAQMIFQSLVQLGEGKEDTRRRLPISKLAIAKYQDVFDTTLQTLIAARLLVVSLDENNQENSKLSSSLAENSNRHNHKITVEIVHEILIRNWQTLRWWLDTNRNQIRLMRELEQKTDEWQQTPDNQKDDFLLSEAELIKYQELYVNSADKLLAEVNKFVELSIKKRDLLKQQEEARRQKEIEQERKARINAQKFIWTLFGGLVVSLGLTGIATWQSYNSRINEINALSNSAEALLASNQELDALVTGLKAGKRIKNSFFGVDNNTKIKLIGRLQNIFYRVKEFNRLEGNTVVLSPDSHTFATANYNATVKLWNLEGKLLHNLQSHRAPVYDIAFTPDGRTIASASADGTVKLWNRKGQLLNTLKGHTARVRKVAFSPDGQIIASTAQDQTIKLWNLQGDLLHTLKIPGGLAPTFAFSPDGKTIASTGNDKKITLWNIQGDLLQTFEGHTEIIWSIAFSPDGKTIASASNDKTVKLWNLQGNLIHNLKGHTDRVNSLAFSPDGQIIASGSSDQTIKLWSIKGNLLHDLQGYRGDIYSDTNIVFSPDGKTIASADSENIKIWKLRERSFYTPLGHKSKIVFHTIRGHTSQINSIVFTPDSQNIISAGENDGIKIWNMQSNLLNIFKGHEGSVNSIAFSPNGQIIASASEDKTIKLWNIKGKLLHTFEGHKDVIASIAFSPDGQIIASTGWDKTIKLWNLQGKLLHTFEGNTDRVNSLAFSPNGQIIVSAGGDKTIKLWNLQGKLLHTLKGHGKNVNSVDFSPDGKIIVSASSDGSVKLWNFQGELFHIWENYRRSLVNDVKFSPDGEKFTSANADGYIRIWDIKGKLLHTRRSNNSSSTDWVNSVVFTPNGQIFASAGNDGTVTLWNLQGELLQTFRVHTTLANDVAFSPDGKKIASAGGDNTVKLLSLDLGDVMKRGCNWARDYLTNNPNVSEEDRKICDGIDTK
jgi:WD40 repeat protein/uncharacterized caspase-like protein